MHLIANAQELVYIYISSQFFFQPKWTTRCHQYSSLGRRIFLHYYPLGLGWLILYVNFTGLRGNQIFGQTLFWMFLWKYFKIRLTFISVDLSKADRVDCSLDLSEGIQPCWHATARMALEALDWHDFLCSEVCFSYCCAYKTSKGFRFSLLSLVPTYSISTV